MKNLGPYKLDAVLGRGGMGTVYRATHNESGEIHAVKVLAPVYSTDDHFRNRFESEIKALIKLDHPNIVRLISYGQHDNNLYFAMELVEGKSLFQLQRGGEQFHWREVIRIAKNVSLGLRHAHDRGVIHRDLKPGNLLKADTGIVKITDFGIAKSFGSSQNTGTNVLGTVDFMSPEQAKGQPVTFRSDLYSLGTVMFTLIAGKPPFSASSVEESMRNLTKVPAPKISRLADVPEDLSELIQQLMNKNPEERTSTALSLYHQLKQVEQNLKDRSQEKTAEIQQPSSAEKTSVGVAQPTDVDVFRGSASTVSIDSDEDATSDDRPDTDVDRHSSIVVKPHSPGPDLKKAGDDHDDFFNTVTDAERQKHLDVSDEQADSPSTAGKMLLAGLLAGVIGIGGYGVFLANRVPAADALIAKIEESWTTPQKRMAEINLFLDNYPDHSRAGEIVERQGLARAFQKAHQLRVRSKGTRQLSDIENSLLSILDDSHDDMPKSVEQLRALIALYENDESLSAEDSECVDAAISSLPVFSRQAMEQIDKVRSNIENQLKRAKTIDEQEAVVLYESIVELNGKYSWASDLVEQAIELADAIKNK